MAIKSSKRHQSLSGKMKLQALQQAINDISPTYHLSKEFNLKHIKVAQSPDPQTAMYSWLEFN